MIITPEQARIHIIKSQLLCSPPKTGIDSSVSALINHLGYVQIDTLAVVNRAHQHTLWTRSSNFTPPLLDQAVKNREIFEYWSHAASYLPISAYRFSLLRKQEYARGKVHWFKDEDPKMKKKVLARIKAEGPLQSKDFEHIKTGTSAWYDWKPAKRALEQLFMEGRLMVKERDNFRKVYDLAERVYPEGMGLKKPSQEEYGEYLIETALRANGLVRPGDIAYLQGHIRDPVQKAILRLIKLGRIVEIQVQGKWPCLTTTGTLDELVNAAPPTNRVHILSPFDNLVIQRKRMQDFFDFDYQIECYVSPANRKYGYFCLPVVYNNQFVARFDPKADKATGVFHIRSFHTEKGWKPSPAFAEAFCTKLRAFAAFNGCRVLEASKDTPALIRSGI
jgi:uncharacterized protein YcaQ